jgi:hypothetical protein
VHRFGHCNLSTIHLFAGHFLNRILGIPLLHEPHKGKPFALSGLWVLWDVNVTHLTKLFERLSQVCLVGLEGDVVHLGRVQVGGVPWRSSVALRPCFLTTFV